MATGVAGAVQEVIDALRDQLGDRLSTGDSIREQHGRDEGWHAGSPPDAVAFATSTEEVSQIVKLCAAHRVPIIPFGVGTSLEGHVAAVQGGVCIDLSRMDRVLEVNAEDLDCRVEAGVTRKTLNAALVRDGLFFPIDPGADATIGGMTATRASGTNAVRYGTMRDAVLGLTAVLADGSIVRTGTRARKSSAGYDLTRLLVGSEGTLAVITEISLRVHGIPECIGGATASFSTLDGAVRAVIETIQLGIPVARLELLDAMQVAACNSYSGLDLPVAPMLLIEFHGSEAVVADHAASVQAISESNGGTGWAWSTDQGERDRLWRARHDAFYAAKALRPGSAGVPTDVCVPISRLAECIDETRRDIDASGLIGPILGHVGDGNFHVILLFDENDMNETQLAMDLHHRMVTRALAMGGTCTGEHGVGYGKLDFMRAEHDAGSLQAMRLVKDALDPHHVFNPGKLVPAEA